MVRGRERELDIDIVKYTENAVLIKLLTREISTHTTLRPQKIKL